MKILKFTGQLEDVMGEDARKTWDKDLGLKFHSGHQNVEEGITLMEVIDETKCQKYFSMENVEEITPAQANATITEKMDKVTHKVTSDNLMGANLREKSKDKSKLDLDEMLPEWTEEHELDFLYKKGISGIKKNVRVVKKFKE